MNIIGDRKIDMLLADYVVGYVVGVATAHSRFDMIVRSWDTSPGGFVQLRGHRWDDDHPSTREVRVCMPDIETLEVY